MERRKKYAVRKAHGSMCNVCGLNAGKGGALKKHIESVHEINYEDYKKCFYGDMKTLITDIWDDTTVTTQKKSVKIHVLVRRFIGEPTARGVRKAAK